MPRNVTNIPCSVQAAAAAQLRRRKALADALAGVVATLVSLWTFYPIDVLKTNLQAGLDTTDDDGGNGGNKKTKTREEDENSASSSLSLLVFKIRGLFRGLTLKTLHATSSSFTYFYLYSFIVSWWTQRNNSNKKMSPAVRLSLSAIAAMMNTLLTLPLDVLASKKQAASALAVSGSSTCNNSSNNKSNETNSTVDETQEESESSCGVVEGLTLVQQQQLKMDKVWKNLEIANCRRNNTPEVFYDSCSEEQPVSNSRSNSRSNSNVTRSSYDSQDEEEETKEEEDVGYKTSYKTNGHLTVTVTTATTDNYRSNKNKLLSFEPTTSTATNINNTCRTKEMPSENVSPEISSPSSLLSQIPSLWKGLYPSLLLCSNPSIHYTVFDVAKSHLLLQTKRTNNSNLSMKEAFLLGLFAKFCATIATYPLIRAKVMLMVTSRKSMLRTLIENYQQDGFVKGLYKGCSVQLLHTVLKSALLMMVKERIATTTHQLLVPPTPPTRMPPSSSSSASAAATAATRR